MQISKQCNQSLFLNCHLLCLLAAILFAGCAARQAAPVSEEDNPLHHYSYGMQAIQSSDFPGAQKKFDRALQLDEEFAPALAGKALVRAFQANTQAEKAHRDVDIEESLALLKKARKSTESKAEKYIVNTTGIRIYTILKTPDWLDQAKSCYATASEIDADPADLPYYLNSDAADYFMAVAWYHQDYHQATALLHKILGARNGGKWQAEADTLYARIQKIIRASANRTLTQKAQNIATKEEVTRGDVAALIIDELKLDRLFAGRIPRRSQMTDRTPEYTPADILEHPFRNEIETLMKWEVRGLTPAYDPGTRAWLFKPQSPTKRKELALILEDVLIKLTGDEKIAVTMMGMDNSPFPDIPVGSAWFNAAMTVTSRGLMEADLSGEFRPDAPADGAELLLAVFKLRNALNIH